MKNIIKLEHYYSPEVLEPHIAEFVDYYNKQWYHESLNNVTPADVHFGRDQEVLAWRFDKKVPRNLPLLIKFTVVCHSSRKMEI